jgi:hypothetical protein
VSKVKIPAPQFEIFETVEPTPDAPIKPASRVGKVEGRSWVEFRGEPGYWRYTVRWPGGGTSSEPDKHLRKGLREGFGLQVVVGGQPFSIGSWTTENVSALKQRVLEQSGLVKPCAAIEGEWTLRTEKGVALSHIVGDADFADGERVLFLDPVAGAGGEDSKESVEKERAALRIDTAIPILSPVSTEGFSGGVEADEELHLSAEQLRDELADGEGWKGTPPAEGTRRKLIYDVIRRQLIFGAASNERVLEIADAVESALLKSTIAAEDDGREADAQEAINAVGEALDRLDAPQAATFAERIDRLYREPREARDSPSQVHRLLDKANALLDEASIPPNGGILTRLKELLRRFDIAERMFVGDNAELEESRSRLKRIYRLATETGGPPRHTCDLYADLREIAGIARADYPAEPPAAATPQPDAEEADEKIEYLESEVGRLLGQREEARVGESRFAEERDCAFALLRWLLPVTVAKRLEDD